MDIEYFLHSSETERSLFDGPRHLCQSNMAEIDVGSAILERLLKLRQASERIKIYQKRGFQKFSKIFFKTRHSISCNMREVLNKAAVNTTKPARRA